MAQIGIAIDLAPLRALLEDLRVAAERLESAYKLLSEGVDLKGVVTSFETKDVDSSHFA